MTRLKEKSLRFNRRPATIFRAAGGLYREFVGCASLELVCRIMRHGEANVDGFEGNAT